MSLNPCTLLGQNSDHLSQLSQWCCSGIRFYPGMRFHSGMRFFLDISKIFHGQASSHDLVFHQSFLHIPLHHLWTRFFFIQFLAKLDWSTVVCVFSNVSGKTASFTIFQGDHIPVHFSQKRGKKNTRKLTSPVYESVMVCDSFPGIRSLSGMRCWLVCAVYVEHDPPMVCVTTSGMRWGLGMCIYMDFPSLKYSCFHSFLFLPILVLVFTVKHVCELIIWIVGFSASQTFCYWIGITFRMPKKKCKPTDSTINGIHDAS